MWLMNSISSAQVCSSGYLIVVEFVGRLADMTDAARYGLSDVCLNKNVPDGLFIVLSSRYALAVQVLGMECLFGIDSLCRRVLTDLVRCRAFMGASVAVRVAGMSVVIVAVPSDSVCVGAGKVDGRFSGL